MNGVRVLGLFVLVGLSCSWMFAQSMPAGELHGQHVRTTKLPGAAVTSHLHELQVLNEHLAAARTELDKAKVRDKTTHTAEAQSVEVLQKKIEAAKATLKTCTLQDVVDRTGTVTKKYYYRLWLPLFSANCAKKDDQNQDGAATINFFTVAKQAVIANQVQYMFNAKQSTNQVTGDVFTGTFPGFQAILSGTATAGSSQPAPVAAGSSAGQQPMQTDSVATTVAKLQSGGDFNVRFPLPLARAIPEHQGFDLRFSPNVGFNVNGLTSTATVTESTQYAVNLPLEAYYELGSYENTGGVSDVQFYLDARYGGELISTALKTAIGVPDRIFQIGQASAGIVFMGNIRLGFQYFIGPKQSYTVPNASGTGTAPVTGSMSGLHLVVSYNPSPKS